MRKVIIIPIAIAALVVLAFTTVNAYRVPTLDHSFVEESPSGIAVVELTVEGLTCRGKSGILANQLWSFMGDSDRHSVSKGIFQYFIVRSFEGGWYVNSAPIISFNWKADEGQGWVVPFGAGIGKIVRVGKLPLYVQVGAYYNVVKPDIGPDWQIRFQAQILLPAGILKGD